MVQVNLFIVDVQSQSEHVEPSSSYSSSCDPPYSGNSTLSQVSSTPALIGCDSYASGDSACATSVGSSLSAEPTTAISGSSYGTYSYAQAASLKSSDTGWFSTLTSSSHDCTDFTPSPPLLLPSPPRHSILLHHTLTKELVRGVSSWFKLTFLGQCYCKYLTYLSHALA